MLREVVQALPGALRDEMHRAIGVAMKKPRPSWKKYKIGFSEIQLTIIDDPGIEWIWVFAGIRKKALR